MAETFSNILQIPNDDKISAAAKQYDPMSTPPWQGQTSHENANGAMTAPFVTIFER
jgi:hypothetical protein